jgi:hypothetical protein
MNPFFPGGQRESLFDWESGRPKSGRARNPVRHPSRFKENTDMNIKILSIPVAAFLFSTAVFAKEAPVEAGPKPVSERSGRANAVLVRTPDFVSAVITLTDSNPDPLKSLDAIRENRQLLLDAVRQNPEIHGESDPIEMSAVPRTEIAAFDSLNEVTKAQVEVFMSLAEGNLDIFEACRRIRKFAETLSPTGETRVEVSGFRLGVYYPEKYRSKLLMMMREEIEKIVDALDVRADVHISGLEKPVGIRQINDHEVEVYLDYTISLQNVDL